MKEKIKLLVEQNHLQVVAFYEHLHAHPELSYKEYKTSQYIQRQLANMGIVFKAPIAGTGILAWIEGCSEQGPTLALRADMDALAIEEENEVSFRSTNPQVMHACGHDSHVASLLGVAQIMLEMRDSWSGRLLLVFQPGEEKHPGGARLMLEDGVFAQWKPSMMIAQHAFIDYGVGEVGFESGTIMAAADEIHLKIKGNGGHGALPHTINDTVLAAAQCVVSMQQIVSRRSDPFSPSVLSFGKFIAPGETNIIPNEVQIAGSLRTMNEDERLRLRAMIVEIAESTAKAHACVCEIEVYDGYPCVNNDEELTNAAKNIAIEYLGKDKVKGLSKRMTSEDFGFFSQQIPSTFYRFGVQGRHLCEGLHTPRFLIDSEALKTSVGTMTYLAYKLMSKNTSQ
ncbi:aminobenzoyl-glutamate utilization protein A [Bacteroidales bacterium]|nr:aminobenzoyl-glutamate utilization protein A [Bacteroidales bacterium]